MFGYIMITEDTNTSVCRVSDGRRKESAPTAAAAVGDPHASLVSYGRRHHAWYNELYFRGHFRLMCPQFGGAFSKSARGASLTKVPPGAL